MCVREYRERGQLDEQRVKRKEVHYSTVQLEGVSVGQCETDRGRGRQYRTQGERTTVIKGN